MSIADYIARAFGWRIVEQDADKVVVETRSGHRVTVPEKKAKITLRRPLTDETVDGCRVSKPAGHPFVTITVPLEAAE